MVHKNTTGLQTVMTRLLQFSRPNLMDNCRYFHSYSAYCGETIPSRVMVDLFSLIHLQLTKVFHE